MGIKNKFLASGIGSLPFTDAKRAVSFVLEEFKDNIVFLPQLPKRSFLESMHIQFSEGFPGVKIIPNRKSMIIDSLDVNFVSNFEKSFNAINSGDIEYFAIGVEYAEGYHEFFRIASSRRLPYVKSQIIGPISFGLTILDEKGKPILLNPELREIIPKFLGFKSIWQILQLKNLKCAEEIIIFIDEPYLVAIGSNQFGSFKRDGIISMINVVVKMIHQEGAIAGIHCCGNTDWSICFDTDVDIISFDAFDFLDSLFIYKEGLVEFIERGGIIAWGIVPNKDNFDFNNFLSRAVKIISSKSAFLKNGAIITPSCGCGTLSEAQAKKIHSLSVQIAKSLAF